MYRRKYFAAICALYIPTRTLYMVEDHKMFSRQITSNLIFKACADMHRFIVVCAFMCRKLLKHEQKDKLILMRNNRRLWHAYSNEFLAKAWGRKFVCVHEFMKIQFSWNLIWKFSHLTHEIIRRLMMKGWSGGWKVNERIFGWSSNFRINVKTFQ